MAGEALVEELRLQLEIARQEVIDEQQLGQRRLQQGQWSSQRDADVAAKTRSYALKRIASALLWGTRRQCRHWLEACRAARAEALKLPASEDPFLRRMRGL